MAHWGKIFATPGEKRRRSWRGLFNHIDNNTIPPNYMICRTSDVVCNLSIQVAPKALENARRILTYFDMWLISNLKLYAKLTFWFRRGILHSRWSVNKKGNLTITSEDLIYCNNCQGLKKYVRTIFCEEFEQVDLKKVFQQVSLKNNTSGPEIPRKKIFVPNSLSLSFTTFDGDIWFKVSWN